MTGSAVFSQSVLKNNNVAKTYRLPLCAETWCGT